MYKQLAAVMDIPSEDVIRHWVAWGYTEGCPDEYVEHDPVRVRQFEAWLAEVKADAFKRGKEYAINP
jgi:hypothetical protein